MTKQGRIDAVLTESQKQADACVELREAHETAKKELDEALEELLDTMHAENISEVSMRGVTFRIESKEKLKVEGKAGKREEGG